MSCPSDNHFAQLVKNLKSDSGFINFRFITEWYNKHYLSVDDESVHKYIFILGEIISEYVQRNNFMTMAELVKVLSYDGFRKAYRAKFKDLSDEMNGYLEYRILAELCNKLIWTEWKKIPGHELLS